MKSPFRAPARRRWLRSLAALAAVDALPLAASAQSPARSSAAASAAPAASVDRDAAGRPSSADAAAEPIRIAVIEGFSGAFANAGAAVWRNLRFAAERINARGGVRVGARRHPLHLIAFDSKGQTEEALVQLQKAADQSIPFVMQGNSSAIAAALIDAIDRHNSRAPDRAMLFFNYAAVDPALTNERCSFWHFRFDADARMRMSALIDALAQNPRIRRVYLLNQDYSFGRQVASLATAMLADKRPDVTIVADELLAMGRVKDFAPYAAKIRASGADAVITGNWGNDLTLLVRAARDGGADVVFYTFYANSLGAPQALADSGPGRVFAVSEWHPNAGIAEGERILDAFRATVSDPRDDYFNMRHVVMFEMVAAAIERAGGTRAVAVARALEGARYGGPPYAVTMRADDHQILTPQYVSVMARRGEDGIRYDVEGSGVGFRTVRFVSADEAAAPHACRMKRPG
ncbi:MAG: branched-chain amino acid ABC transporter substrate-binding protein [Burkholderiaceae bacterium]